MVSPSSWQYQQIQGAYKQHLGREGSDQEILSHLGGGSLSSPDSVNWAVNNIQNSPEAQEYKKKQAAASQSAQAQQPAAQSSAPPPATGSPVQANGQIAPPSSVPQPTQLPTPAQRGNEPNETRYLQKIDLGNVPDYQQRSFNVNIPQAYQPGQLAPAYQADHISQFSAPDQSAPTGQQNALMSAILGNPQTMNPQVVAQMKEAAKQQALSMQQQQQQQLDSNAAGRPGALGSGAMAAAQQLLGQSTQGNILNSNRALDIQAAQTNRQDELNALNASEGVLSGQMGRASQSFGTGLSGQTAQAQTNQAAAGSALQRAIAGEQNKQAAFDSSFRNAGLDLNVQQANANEAHYSNEAALNKALAQFGINRDVANDARANYNQDVAVSQIPFGQNMQIADLLERMRQFNTNTAFNYDQLDQNGQQGILNWLIQSGAA